MNNNNNTIELLKCLNFAKPTNSKLEQYFTPIEIALRYLQKIDFKNKVVIDLGAGSGILGLIALILGAKKVIFVEIDKSLIEIAEKNYDALSEKAELGSADFLNKDVSLIRASELADVEIAILNPPFGTTDENKKLDVIFLKKAMKIAKTILTMHKTAAKDFIMQVLSDSKFNLVYSEDFLFPLSKQYSHHKEDVRDIQVSVFIVSSLKNNKL